MLLIEDIVRARIDEREREIAAGIRRRALLGPRSRRGPRFIGLRVPSAMRAVGIGTR